VVGASEAASLAWHLAALEVGVTGHLRMEISFDVQLKNGRYVLLNDITVCFYFIYIHT